MHVRRPVAAAATVLALLLGAGACGSDAERALTAPAAPEAGATSPVAAPALEGTVVWWDEASGTGFVAPDDGGREVRVDVADATTRVRPGDHVAVAADGGVVSGGIAGTDGGDPALAEDDLVGTGSEQGIVKWFNDAKGYGFIVRERGADVFVHHASIIADGFRTLGEGDRVVFELVEGPKGLQAKNVVKVG